jgi:hypothetical protein
LTTNKLPLQSASRDERRGYGKNILYGFGNESEVKRNGSPRVVHMDPQHMNHRGDHMECKYDATYHFGKVIVHVVAPPPMSDEEKGKILSEYYRHAWAAWNSLPAEERLKINKEYEKRKV